MHMVFRRDIRALGKDGSHNSEGADGNKGQVDSSAPLAPDSLPGVAC